MSIEPPVTIDSFVAALEKGDWWPDNLEMRSKKNYARALIRMLPEWVSVLDKEKKPPVRSWKQMAVLTDEELDQKINYWTRIEEHAQSRIKDFKGEKEQRRRQGGLPFPG